MGHGPPKRKFGGLPPISNQYIEPVEQLSYCLMSWILATFITKTKVFLLQYQTNTYHHLPSDLKRYHLVVSTNFIITKLKNLRVCHIYGPTKKLILAMPLYTTLLHMRQIIDKPKWKQWMFLKTNFINVHMRHDLEYKFAMKVNAKIFLKSIPKLQELRTFWHYFMSLSSQKLKCKLIFSIILLFTYS